MTPDESFMQAIRQNTDDDTLRLIYADWLEEHGNAARAQFIRAQIDLEQFPLPAARRAELEDREANLLSAHDAEWLTSPPPSLFEWSFRRGFVERIVVHGPATLDGYESLFARHPAEDVEVRGGGHLADLAGSPLLDRISRLHINSSVDDPAPLCELLRSRELSRLTALRLMLGDAARDDLIPFLAEQPIARRLHELRLDSLSAAGLARLLVLLR
jgi:uncharacterized protein (TIGR02996 family)